MVTTPTIADASSIGNADLPAVSGCYVLFVRLEAASQLGIRIDRVNPVLYVGKAEDSIGNRVQGTHIVSGRTGSSTLRRSIGALLRESLGLRPVPRSTNRSDSKRFVNYAFELEDEEALAEWIKANVLVTGVPDKAPLDGERQLIGALRPPLNLTGWANPQSATIKARRAECSQLAAESEGKSTSQR